MDTFVDPTAGEGCDNDEDGGEEEEGDEEEEEWLLCRCLAMLGRERVDDCDREGGRGKSDVLESELGAVTAFHSWKVSSRARAMVASGEVSSSIGRSRSDSTKRSECSNEPRDTGFFSVFL